MIFFTKATTPVQFRPSVVRCRTLSTALCTTNAPSTKLSATTSDAITATDTGSNASSHTVRFWATICKTVHPDRCLSVLSVTLVYCCQTVGWIKMKLGMQVGLGPGHIMLHGYPAPLPKGAQSPIFGPYLLWPNGWMDKDATWYGGKPRPRLRCVR